jgi:hypothetical protein
MANKDNSGMTIIVRSFLFVAMAMGVNKVQALNNVLSPAETRAGFKLLFDGVSTSQWTINWAIDDSAMYSPNTGAMIYTKEEFTNFEWKVDFKMNVGGNSGFFIRTKKDWYCDGFEVAALDSKAGGDAGALSNSANGDKLPAGIFDQAQNKNFTAGSDAPIKRSGSIYDIYPTTKNGITIPKGGVYVDLMKPALEWNSLVIWANGTNIETWLNGIKVTDFVIGSKDFMDRFHRSKFGNGGNQCGDDYASLPTGTLVVQDHGAGLRVWMRNNKIRPITAGEKLSSPVISPAGGTFNSPTKVDLDAGITGAEIHYTIDGSVPSATSPLYNDSTQLLISATTTLKTMAVRSTFIASDVTTAIFNLVGTGIQIGRLGIIPEVSVSQAGQELAIHSLNGMGFSVDLVSLDGEKIASRSVKNMTENISLGQLKSGVYLVKMFAGDWMQTKRVVVP